MPIQVSRGEIERGKITVGSQGRIDQADALEQFPPIDSGHQAHARDDVANRHVGRAEKLLLVMNDLVRGSPLGCQALVQPEQCRQHSRVLLTKPLDQLDRESR